MKSTKHTSNRLSVAFGPRMPGFGSWDWVGADTAQALAKEFEVQIFDNDVPECDVVVFIKFKPQTEFLRALKRRTRIIYCPIDFYGSAVEIDEDAPSLTQCDQILVHCERLRKYFSPYATTQYIDHHLKFAAPLRTEFRIDGPVLWVGVRSNLSPVVDWVNRHPFQEELWVLTNPEDPGKPLDPREFGFRDARSLRIENWTPERHREWTSLCRGAFDVKGEGFRSAHKPPAKALDFIASGVPLMLEHDGSTAEHLRKMGFEVTQLGDIDRWRSQEYWEESVAFGRALSERLCLDRVASGWSEALRNTCR